MSLLKRIGAGVATGGWSEAARMLNKDGTTVTQQPLRTPEELEAQQALLKYGTTGTMGGYTAGDGYTGSLGNFNMSAMEQDSQSALQRMMTAGNPELFGQGSTMLKDLMTTDKYDPTKAGGAYDMMQGKMDRNITNATDAARRSASYAGNLYSKDAIRSYGDVAARGAEDKNSILASMYQTYMGQKLGGINQAFGAAQQDQSMGLERINAGYSAGALPRNLQTAGDQAKYQEWQRARGEKQGQLQALSTVANSRTPWGTPSVTLPGQSGWETLLNIGAQVAPAALKAMA